jgi:hypothetical protein
MDLCCLLDTSIHSKTHNCMLIKSTFSLFLLVPNNHSHQDSTEFVKYLSYDIQNVVAKWNNFLITCPPCVCMTNISIRNTQKYDWASGGTAVGGPEYCPLLQYRSSVNISRPYKISGFHRHFLENSVS